MPRQDRTELLGQIAAVVGDADDGRPHRVPAAGKRERPPGVSDADAGASASSTAAAVEAPQGSRYPTRAGGSGALETADCGVTGVARTPTLDVLVTISTSYASGRLHAVMS